MSGARPTGQRLPGRLLRGSVSRPRSTGGLDCSFCAWTANGRYAKAAVSVVEGYAVCSEHRPFVAMNDERFLYIVKLIRRARAALRLSSEVRRAR